MIGIKVTSLICSTIRKIFSLAFFLFYLNAALANDSVVVLNPFTGQNTYEVVFESEKNTTDVPAGIYAINRKGKSIPAILGHVLGVNRGFNGFLAQTSFHGSNQDTATSIAVIDGKLNIFNKNTNFSDPKKQPLFLGGQNFEIFDPNTGLSIKDSINIASLDHINLKDVGRLMNPAPLMVDGQIFILSVKQKNSFGDGLTVAFIMESPKTADAASQIFNNKAYVLSYDFMTEQSLGRLVTASGSDSIFKGFISSPNLVRSLIQRYRNQVENPLIGQWIKYAEDHLSSIQRFNKSESNAKKSSDAAILNPNGVPLFNILNQQIVYESLPAIALSSNDKDELKLIQIFDPRNDTWVVLDRDYLKSNALHEFQKLKFIKIDQYSSNSYQAINGQVNFDDRGKYKISSLDPKNKVIGDQEYLINVGSSSVFLLRSVYSRQLKSVTIPNIRITDYRSLDVLHLKQDPADGEAGQFHHLLISTISKSGKKSLVAIGLREVSDGDFVHVHAEEVTSAYISREEMVLRTKLISTSKNSGLFFDVEKPFLGAVAYKKRLLSKKGKLDGETQENFTKSEESNLDSISRTVKYFYLPNKKMNRTENSAYLRAAKSETAVANGVLTYLQFGDKNTELADTNYTGFYFDFSNNWGKINDESLTLERPLFNEARRFFVPGRPLYYQKKKVLAPMSLDYLSMAIPNRGDVDLSVVPYVNNLKITQTSEASFKLIITAKAVNSNRVVLPTSFISADVPVDFGSLIGAKIVKGIRSNSNHFHILFFFGKDPQSTTGVYSMSGFTDLVYRNGEQFLELKTTNSGSWLTKDLINPSELTLRLKADATGNYFWVDNPEQPTDSVKLRVRDLSNPRSLIHINKATDSYGRIQLRFEEEIGGEKGASDLYGKWQIVARYELNLRYPWFKQYIESVEAKLKSKSEKNSKNKSALDDEFKNAFAPNYISDERILADHKPSSVHFVDYLESLARAKDNNIEGNQNHKLKRQIILVEEKMKKAFLNDLMMQLFGKGKNFSLKPDRKGKFYFYGYDVTSTIEESLRELKSISDNSVRSNTVLFSSLEEINNASPLVHDDSKNMIESTTESDPSEEVTDDLSKGERQKKLSRWLLLATEGSRSDLALLQRKISPTQVKIPTLIIGTPQELIEARKQNPEAVAAGVFDNFEINSEFLTSSWMMWAPGGEHAIPKINEYSQLSISEEEHKVFPEIDRILSEAGKGLLKGKQKVLIVSKELKPLINKLIMTRWASQNVNTTLPSPWHHSNDRLLFYSIQGDRSHNSQDKVFENYQAMHGGAKYKSVVLYADLENINAIGRPFNPTGSNFTLKDPLISKSSARSDFISIDDADSVNNEENGVTKSNIQTHALLTTRDTLQSEIDQYASKRDSASDDDKKKYEQAINERQSKISSIDSQLASLMTNVNMGDHQAMPHLMWLIATEGEKLQPKIGRDWSISSAVDKKLATILIATPEEWSTAEHDMGFEAKYFDPKDHFEFVELASPSEETKFNLVRSLFLKAEIQSLDYRFFISSNSNEDAERQLISHFVNRVEQIAIQQNIESTTAFIKAFAELRRTLVEDTSLRRSRTIDKNFLERLFFKIFPLPISLENLESDDPLNRLQNIQDAARKLQQLGYHGAMDLKERTLDTILNQTRGSDAGRPIPNSQIYFGGTSSGKTFLFKKKVEMLGLTPYNPNKANNEEAEYIIISVQNLVEDGSKEAGKLTVDDAIEMIQDLIAQPKGHRSFILFDDAHKTSSKVVHQKLFSFLQSLFEAPNGLIRVKKKGTKDFKEVPVQNLNLYMTVNPTANKQQKEKYAEGDNLNRLVLAALANHGVDMEESMLARWSDIINLDQFPRGAKVPALVERVRKASSSTAATVLVDAKVIDALVERYPDENAREFLSPAASALTRIPIAAEKSSLYIVTRRLDTLKNSSGGVIPNRNGGFLTSTELNQTVKEITQVEPILIDQPSSLAKLVEFLIGNFRMQVYNYTILSAQNTEVLRLNSPGQSTILQKNFVLSAMTHILKNPSLPLNEVRIMGEDFSYLSDAQLQELVEIVIDSPVSDAPYFPFDVDLRENFSPFGLFSLIGNQSNRDLTENTRNQVMRDTVSEIEKIFKKMLRLYTQIPNGDLNHTLTWTREDIVFWYESLPSKDPVDEYKVLTQELIMVYKKFIENFNDNNLMELSQPMILELSLYDHGRIFSYLIDKALTRLPWGLMSKFVLDIMSEAKDLSLGQKPNFINYAYSYEISPLAIVTTDFLNETFSSEVSDSSRVNSLDSNFKNSCEILLRSSGKE